MKRVRKHVRPQLEPLESIALLSGMGTAAHVHAHFRPAVQHAALPTLTTPAPLSGTVQGIYVAHKASTQSTATYQFFAGGNLTPIGRAGLNGSLQLSGLIATGSGASASAGVTGSGTFHVHARGGSLTLQVTTATATPTSGSSTGQLALTYTVTSATGTLQAEQGETGTIDVSLRSFIPSVVHLSTFDVGHATMRFGPAPTSTT